VDHPDSLIGPGRSRVPAFPERVAKSDFLVVRSEVHQLIGRYEGRITPDGGQAVSVDGLVEWAEERHARRWSARRQPASGYPAPGEARSVSGGG